MSIDNKYHVAGTLVLVVLVVLAGCAAGGGGGAGDGGGDGGVVGPSAAEVGTGGADAAASFYLDEERIVVREATMGVEVRSFDPAFDRARAVVRESGGFVADWSVDVERGWHRATLQIEVPARNFSHVRDGLAALGSVGSEHVQAKDFTARYEDAGARLADLRQRERELASILERTEDPNRAYRVERDLAEVRSTIRDFEAERTSLERRDALSTITLTLREPAGQRAPRTYDAAAGFGPTFLSAFYAGVAVVKYVAAVVGFVLPVGAVAVVGVVGALVGVRLSRRLRARLEAALARLGLAPPDGER